MCGIVGVVGTKKATAEVLEGLKRLEYRGYDSSGIASLQQGSIELRKATGKISALEDVLLDQPFDNGTLAIGHTRWATHGAPNTHNAHPHCTNRVAVVHNGIIENYIELRERLEKEGSQFVSETDTETIPQEITWYLEKRENDPFKAVQHFVSVAEGAFAFGAVFDSEENMIIASRRGAPLVVGLSDEHNYLGSDPMALAPFCSDFLFLEDNDVAIITPTHVRVFNADGAEVNRPIETMNISASDTTKGDYAHFMLKEIHEQPRVVGETLSAFLNETQDQIMLPTMPFDLASVPQITIVACGTSYYAASVAKYWIEQYAKTPVNVDVASEFRYRQPPLIKGGLCLFISQSGETADTLAALEYVKSAGQHVLSIVNVPNSSIDRESHVSLYTRAGVEIGVASTKAFTTQLTVLGLLALEMGRMKGTLDESDFQNLLKEWRKAPQIMSETIALEHTIKDLAPAIQNADSALFLGRGAMTPIAFEGALKLKEISYIHAEGYASGEMKHGPIALIDEETPSVFLCPSDDLFDKNISNMQEVEARGGLVLMITDGDEQKSVSKNDKRMLLTLPQTPKMLQPLIYSIPVQLLAYQVAVLKGTDVDQPRNLAKSVTVE